MISGEKNKVLINDDLFYNAELRKGLKLLLFKSDAFPDESTVMVRNISGIKTLLNRLEWVKKYIPK